MRYLSRPTVTITTVNLPSAALKAYAASGMPVIVVGDAKTPRFELEGCKYYGIQDQIATDLVMAQVLPMNHYCRKNLAYLIAMQQAAAPILESDDDNLPRAGFFGKRSREVHFFDLARGLSPCGQKILPTWQSLLPGVDVQRRYLWKTLRGKRNSIPGPAKKCSASARNSCSPSPRKTVRNHPGILFALSPECSSGCPGIRISWT